MSTHIETGFRLKAPGLDQLITLLPIWRDRFLGLAQETQDRFVAKRAAEIIDHRRFEELGPLHGCEDDIEVSALDAALGEMRKRQRQSSRDGRRDPAIDFEMKLVFMPHADEVYGIALCEHGAWLEAFWADPAVHHFPYWDNTDGPRDVDPEAWRARGALWEAAIGTGSIGRRGLAAEIVDNYWLRPTTSAAAVRHQPSLAERARPHALALALARVQVDRVSSTAGVVRLIYEIQEGKTGDLAGATVEVMRRLEPRLEETHFLLAAPV